MNFFEALAKCGMDKSLVLERKLGSGWTEDTICSFRYENPLRDFVRISCGLSTEDLLEDVWDVVKKKEEPLKLEVGCYYEARCGQIFFIIMELREDNEYDFVGFDEGPDCSESFLDNGEYLTEKRQSNLDLIKKLPDQKWPWVEELKRAYKDEST